MSLRWMIDSYECLCMRVSAAYMCLTCVPAVQPGKVEQHLGAFWREADLLAKLNHPNVLRMYGVVCEAAHDPTIVGIMTEYVRGGSLSANLRYGGVSGP